MRGWWQDLTDLVLPAECGGCGTPRTVLCQECRAALSGDAPCRVRPGPEPSGLPAVHAAAPYADAVRAALLAHKERGALALAGPLGAALAGAVRAGLHAARSGAGGALTGHAGVLTGRCGIPTEGGGGPAGKQAERDGSAQGVPVGARRVRVVSFWGGGAPVGHGDVPVLLVPVPSARWAVRARGHDPVRRIALAAASELRRSGTPARVATVLRQRRAVADQSGLDTRQRLRNLAGALEVAPGGARLLLGGRVVLVDDLMTTGASLTEAARAVREAVDRNGGTTAVYARAAREGREEQTVGSREESAMRSHGAVGMARANTVGQPICAAVVAAPPDSFEINRN
ncbi:ComF family protein [Streptomyces sp. HUAS TT20]|uniref:ComF family protein n=1 Tax=Streptomyces sp. HUAS TT20 TaxID=3447509 RepID=UPI0021DA735E|nr:ComF family protein [Streptomyces sp. HUAS 15-9]UXY27931.1 ComF family protein [Streptomyces sp. HUAS 15-9]